VIRLLVAIARALCRLANWLRRDNRYAFIAEYDYDASYGEFVYDDSEAVTSL
jgi:hypothetical protein